MGKPFLAIRRLAQKSIGPWVCGGSGCPPYVQYWDELQGQPCPWQWRRNLCHRWHPDPAVDIWVSDPLLGRAFCHPEVHYTASSMRQNDEDLGRLRNVFPYGSAKVHNYSVASSTTCWAVDETTGKQIRLVTSVRCSRRHSPTGTNGTLSVRSASGCDTVDAESKWKLCVCLGRRVRRFNSGAPIIND